MMKKAAFIDFASNKSLLRKILKIPTVEEKFKQIYDDIGVPYVSVYMIDYIAEHINDKVDEIVKKYKMGLDEKSNWDEKLLIGLLKKGINPVATETIVTSASLLVDEALKILPVVDNPVVLELGCGAGWSTVVLYMQLQKLYKNNFRLISCDKSIHSLAVTSLLLESQNIEYNICETFTDLTKYPSGVSLILGEFRTVVSSFPNNSLHAIYSNNGVTYLGRSEQMKLLNLITSKLSINGSFISDSLNKQLVLGLDARYIKSGVFWGNNIKRTEKNKEVRGTYIHNDIITKLYGMSTLRFLDFLHFLFWNYKHIFAKYTDGLDNSIESQKLLHTWIEMSSNDVHLLANLNVLSDNVISIALPEKYNHIRKFEQPYMETVWLQKNK